ncbi:hypothetical protein HanRHA438_Chr02g0086181 [Helianthus annuus]|uniref:Uncharacterized protein n=1 Tax=Helianthus annuus TaxID=4232 RepID=A0A9K3JQ93_HELAN|nr:hypothetical protein HanXRQr2_Chr02g0074741 [Helianthus annuus]KAJ0605375.1 hypothetical protein HanHA300_Chr02g0062341 [Helianthus annuus]KAJ0619395.1 hypothetical protein HanHA89_Chr02g0070891 [Helianthus annuus]KAJ0940686.1 hypothetical protein HanRHA438_Chr02g0086181 [Helianthus annuus]
MPPQIFSFLPLYNTFIFTICQTKLRASDNRTELTLLLSNCKCNIICLFVDIFVHGL